MDTQELVQKLEARGISLSLCGQELSYSSAKPIPRGVVTTIEVHRKKLTEHLEARQKAPEGQIIGELRHQLGEFPPAVRERLEQIFRTNPPDAWARLLKAADYLGIDGSRADEYADRLEATL